MKSHTRDYIDGNSEAVTNELKDKFQFFQINNTTSAYKNELDMQQQYNIVKDLLTPADHPTNLFTKTRVAFREETWK